MLYDIAVIGGGVTGAGVARDAALRGLKVALVERGRPGGGTTAASTHLIHGGVRYLLYDRLTTHATCWDSGRRGVIMCSTWSGRMRKRATGIANYFTA